MSELIKDIAARFEELCKLKDVRISELEGELEKLERDAETDWEWCHHREQDKDTDEGLPVPRLEIRYERIDDYNWTWKHNLIYRHLLGHVVIVPFGQTKCSGGRGGLPILNGEINLPFREGVHIAHNSAHLAIPAFGIVETHIYAISFPDGKLHTELVTERVNIPTPTISTI